LGKINSFFFFVIEFSGCKNKFSSSVLMFSWDPFFLVVILLSFQINVIHFVDLIPLLHFGFGGFDLSVVIVVSSSIV
jgi:hypothetical protein